MSSFVDYSQVVTAAQLEQTLRSAAVDGVCHYLGDDFALREEDPLIVAELRAAGWPQMGIFVPRLPSVNGAADAQRAIATYRFPLRSRHWLDIEPEEFDTDPAGWTRAADGWCDEMRAGGLSPGVYGVDRTVAACGNHADAIWRAVPGECDPAGPGLNSSYFAGRRAIQCQQGTVAGVEVDISYAQFVIPRGASGGSMFHPTIPGRWDDLIVGAGGAVYHTWGTDPTNRSAESWGGAGIPGTERCEWSPDGQHLLGRVVGVDARIYTRQVNLVGAVEWDWTPAATEFAELPPSGPVGSYIPHNHQATTDDGKPS